MDTKRQLPARSLALVVMAAGVVTASSEFAIDAIGESTPSKLSGLLSGFSDPTLSRTPKVRR